MHERCKLVYKMSPKYKNKVCGTKIFSYKDPCSEHVPSSVETNLRSYFCHTFQCFRVKQRQQRSTSINLRSALREHLSDIHHHTEKRTDVSTAHPDPFPPHSLPFLLLK